MDVYHRISFSPYRAPALQKFIEKLGIPYHTLPLPGYEVGLIYLDIYESHPAWPALAEALTKWPALDRYDTIFSEEEIRAASWLRLAPVYEKEYLQPGDLEWVDYLYEGHCENCGAFKRQKAPVRLKREPKRPKNTFVSPIASYLLLCTPKIAAEMEKADIKGYEVWPVLHHATGKPFEHTVQIYIPRVLNPGLRKSEGLQPQQCQVCGRTKYRSHMRGVMYMEHNAFEGKEDLDILQSHEWFGSGHLAYREIIISNRFAQLILDQGWQGVRMKVIEVV